MRSHFSHSANQLLARVAVLTVLGGLAAACSTDSGRFGENPFGNPFDSRAARTDNMPTGAITNRNGVNRSGGAPTPSVSSAPLAAPAISQRLPAAPATMGSSANWSARGGNAVTVAPGESVMTLSNRYGVPPQAILSANGLQNASQVRPGQQLTIPVFNGGKAPATSALVPSARPPIAQPLPARPTERLQQMSRPLPVQGAKVEEEAEATIKTGSVSRKIEAAEKPALNRPAPPSDLTHGAPTAKLAPAKLLPAKPVQDADDEEEAPKKKVSLSKVPTPPVKGKPAPVKAADDDEDDVPAKPVAAKTPEKPAAKLAAKSEAAKSEAAKSEPAKPEAIKVEPAKTAQALPAKKPVEADPEMQPLPKMPDKKVVRQIETTRSDKAILAEARDKSRADPDVTGTVPKEEDLPSAAGDFRWPARGRVIANYSKGTNDGINIALPEGSSVRAADGGTVAYSGNELKGYGNLVLVRHAEGWVTAYAHNGELLVKRGDIVKRGQVIAKSGQSGNVSSPQLHFELRKGATPVDPSPHLN